MKPHSSKKTKKFVASCGSKNLSAVATGEFDGQLWSSNLRRSFLGNYDYVFKGSKAVWSWCQSNDSLAYVNGNGHNVDDVGGGDES